MQPLTLTIIDYNSSGEGVAKPDGFAVFVPFALLGETVLAAIVEQHKSYARAEIIEILEPSLNRIPPECKHFGECGGCGLLHMTYEEELHFKQRKVANALRLSHVEIVPSPIIKHYRNKTVWQTDGKKVGLFARKTNDVVAVENCLLQSEKANATKRERLFYREKKQILCGIEFKVDDKSFFQINNQAAEKMLKIIKRNISSSDKVLDLYCGVGTITLCAAKVANSVVGVEINKQAVQDAIENAQRNKIFNAEFIVSPSERVFDKVDLTDFDVVILDPPRSGCDKRLIETLQMSNVRKIIYISCNPATLARDLKLLNKYELKSATAIDMFPRTGHVEIVTTLNLSLQGES